MKKPLLRVVLLTYDSLYADPVFLPTLDKDFVEIVAIVVSGCIQYRKSTLESLWYLYRKHGIKYFTFKVTDQLLYIISGFKKTFGLPHKPRLGWEAKKRKIPVLTIKDVNSRDSLALLQKYKPDLLISYFNQILYKETLALPKIGCLNIHPGYLPLYRGVGSSFWAMLGGEKFGGVTLHWMVEKLDEGDIVARGKVPVEKEISLHRHNFMCCKLGGALLAEVLYKLWLGKLTGKKQEENGRYYSWPDPKSVDRFLEKGFKLMEWKDLKLY